MNNIITKPVVEAGTFPFAVIGLEHLHIYRQTQGLIEAGGSLTWICDEDSNKVTQFLRTFKNSKVKVASAETQILEDPNILLVAAAATPNERASLGCRVMRSGKDYFTNKSPFTTLEQLKEAREVALETKKKYSVFYSERVDVESSYVVDDIIKNGVIGDVLHINLMGPHRHNESQRPEWFYCKECYGGILTDLCSHQTEQFLHYTGSEDGVVRHARVENFAHPEKSEFEDFGEAIFEMSNGASCHSRVDWFTPDGLQTWGDGRMFISGTKGYLEVRKYVDIANDGFADRIYLVDQHKEQMIDCRGKTGIPFYGQLILDCLNRTENAMSQGHTFKAAELALKAQLYADQKRKMNSYLPAGTYST